MPTALLICMEDTFWNISKDRNFLKLFKKSFTLYVESGMRKETDADIDLLLRSQSGYPATDEFKEKFYNIVIEHCFCKFHIVSICIGHI
jgi:hypothetical protein